MVENSLKSGILHKVPEDMGKCISKAPKILALWNDLTPIQRNEFICWVTSAKKDETQAKRLRIMIENLKEGKKNPCCWPGCPHRRESAKKWFKKKGGNNEKTDIYN